MAPNSATFSSRAPLVGAESSPGPSYSISEYKSALAYHRDLVKHHRRGLGPQQQYKQPMLTSQEVGWESGLVPPEAEHTRFFGHTADLSQLLTSPANEHFGASSKIGF